MLDFDNSMIILARNYFGKGEPYANIDDDKILHQLFLKIPNK